MVSPETLKWCLATSEATLCQGLGITLLQPNQVQAASSLKKTKNSPSPALSQRI